MSESTRRARRASQQLTRTLTLQAQSKPAGLRAKARYHAAPNPMLGLPTLGLKYGLSTHLRELTAVRKLRPQRHYTPEFLAAEHQHLLDMHATVAAAKAKRQPVS